MAQSSRTMSEKTADTAEDAADNMADLGRRAGDKGVNVARETIDKGQELARTSLRAVEKTSGAVGEISRTVAKRSAEGTAEFGQALTDLFKEQTQHGAETLTALSHAVDWEQVVKAVDWKQVAQIQTDYLRVSLERMAHLTQRYFEIGQAVMSSTTSVVANQAKTAA